jgi:hypothetical protein
MKRILVTLVAAFVVAAAAAPQASAARPAAEASAQDGADGQCPAQGCNTGYYCFCCTSTNCWCASNTGPAPTCP